MTPGATAALTAAIAEVRRAYLDLEQGWLCLNPKVETSRDDLVYAAPCRDSQSNPPEAPKQNAASSVSRRGDAQA